MKKILIMAMAVCALVACKKNSSDTGLPKADAKALEVTTTGAVDMLGDSPKQVDAALTKAGYRKIEGGYNPFSAPVREAVAKQLKKAKAESTVEVTYAYGLPENYEEMSQSQAIAWANKALASGDPVMVVTVNYQSDELQAMATMFIIGKSSKANKTFTATSDDLYKKLPSGKANFYWGGYIEDSDAAEGSGTEYTDHSEFVSKVSKAEGIIAEESGVAVYKNWGYGNFWFNPSAEDEKEMLKEGFTTPFCEGAYAIATADYDYGYDY